MGRKEAEKRMQPVHTAYRPMEEELRALREFRKEAVTPWEKGKRRIVTVRALPGMNDF